MKIGILTHYYQSRNYGGLLQAYALCEVIKDMGIDVEQISYDRFSQKKNLKSYVRLYLKKIRDIICYPQELIIHKKIQQRVEALESFEKSIPHSRVYSDENINQSVDLYDGFIVGSDQVWHPNVFCKGYLLSFVPGTKLKLSYAASVAKDELTEEQRQVLKSALQDYTAVSVREEQAVSLLKAVSPVDIEWVLDPTLLLSRQKWSLLCSKCEINEPYLFCYFLGDEKHPRYLAREYAAAHNLKVVNLPHLMGHYRKCDVCFADIEKYDVSPGQFLSLINNASCIFTDSFHAMIFAGIFQRQYFVFDRGEFENMSSRIYSLGELYKAEERFCDTSEKQQMEYLESIQAIDYSIELSMLERMKEKSLNFLEYNLNLRK